MLRESGDAAKQPAFVPRGRIHQQNNPQLLGHDSSSWKAAIDTRDSLMSSAAMSTVFVDKATPFPCLPSKTISKLAPL
jgi:hypothetical protein